MDALKVLKQAKALIEDKSNWTQKTYARDCNGDSVPAINSEAVCFCSVGAIANVTYQSASLAKHLQAETYVDNCALDLYGMTMVHVNDQLGHRAVMNMFDEAIKQAEGV